MSSTLREPGSSGGPPGTRLPPPAPPDAVPYIDRTRELYAAQKPYRWVRNDPEKDPPPWTPLVTPLARARIALIGSAGIYLDDQEPFHFRNDTSHREIPLDTDPARLRVAHFGYDTGDAQRDPGCVFPLQALRLLVNEGGVGEMISPALSFMGGIYSPRRVVQEVAPRFRDFVLRERADLAYLVPA